MLHYPNKDHQMFSHASVTKREITLQDTFGSVFSILYLTDNTIKWIEKENTRCKYLNTFNRIAWNTLTYLQVLLIVRSAC